MLKTPRDNLQAIWKICCIESFLIKFYPNDGTLLRIITLQVANKTLGFQEAPLTLGTSAI